MPRWRRDDADTYHYNVMINQRGESNMSYYRVWGMQVRDWYILCKLTWKHHDKVSVHYAHDTEKPCQHIRKWNRSGHTTRPCIIQRDNMKQRLACTRERPSCWQTTEKDDWKTEVTRHDDIQTYRYTDRTSTTTHEEECEHERIGTMQLNYKPAKNKNVCKQWECKTKRTHFNNDRNRNAR